MCGGKVNDTVDGIESRNSIRQVAERWQHSLSTVSKIVHEVVSCLMKLEKMLLANPCEAERRINQDPKYQAFRGCLDALDGTHIPASIPPLEQGPFRNRKGFISQNVLAVVNLDDLTFSYLRVGWMGRFCA